MDRGMSGLIQGHGSLGESTKCPCRRKILWRHLGGNMGSIQRCQVVSPGRLKLEELAEEGDAESQFRLGVMYETGQGVPQDYAEAVRWYRKAAQQRTLSLILRSSNPLRPAGARP
jgi:hypothetical protein